MADIKLNFINNSNDTNKSSVVIFQSANPHPDNAAQPSHVLNDFAPGETRAVTVTTGYGVQAYATGNGNGSSIKSVTAGQALKAVYMGTQIFLEEDGNAENQFCIQIHNELGVQMTIDLFNNGNNIGMAGAPANGTVTLAIGSVHVSAVSQDTTTETMDSSIVSDAPTELPLQGVASADVVMTGGGVGTDSEPYRFILKNVVKI